MGRFRALMMLACVVCLVAMPPSVNAGGMLVGRVIGKDLNNQYVPLERANVTVYANGVLIQFVSPEFDGSFSILLSSGLYVLTAEHLGFNGSSYVVSISDWRETRVNFYLDRSPDIRGNTFDFGLSSQRPVTILPGQVGMTRIMVTLCSGLPQNVSLSVSGLPSGASASVNPPIVCAPSASICLITTSLGTPVGSYNVTVTGVSARGGLKHNATFTLTISSTTIQG